MTDNPEIKITLDTKSDQDGFFNSLYQAETSLGISRDFIRSLAAFGNDLYFESNKELPRPGTF